MGRDTVLRLLRDQRLAFVLVGGLNTVLGYACFVAIHATLGDRVGYMGSLVGAYAAATSCAFFLHRRFVFRVRGQVVVDLVRFLAVNLAALGLNAVSLPLLVEVVSLPVLLAQAVAIALVAASSYFGHLFFSFRRHHSHTHHRT